MIVDFHSHVLPGIDDGSRNLEESIAMLRREAEQGITHVIATPHFYADHHSPRRFLEKRAAAEAILREEMEKHPGLPRLSVGAEVHYFGGISESDVIAELTIAQKGCILIEMPHSVWSDKMYQEIAGIWSKQGITPIMAHVDRYIRPFHTKGIPERLADLPVYVQANASFFLDRSTQGMAMRMLKKNQIHLLGSDAHNMTGRPPRLGEAVEKIRKRLGDAPLERIAEYQASLL